MPANRGGGNRGGAGRSNAGGVSQNEPPGRNKRSEIQTTPDVFTSDATQRTPRTLPNGRTQVQSGRQFGKQQSTIAKTVGATQKSYAKTKGPNRPKPATSVNAQKNNPRARLPNLDDINEENQRLNGRDGRRFVDYDVYYGTTDPIRNKLKDKLKRSKLRSKKSTGLLGDQQVSTGNSVLDSYRKLGQRLSKGR